MPVPGGHAHMSWSYVENALFIEGLSRKTHLNAWLWEFALISSHIYLTVASFFSVLVSVNMRYHALKYGNVCTLTAGMLASSLKLTEGL